jgi:hypothetical protein
MVDMELLYEDLTRALAKHDGITSHDIARIAGAIVYSYRPADYSADPRLVSRQIVAMICHVVEGLFDEDPLGLSEAN